MELKNINMKKELKKGDVCVKITDKNREKVKAILEMFGEDICSSQTLSHEYIIYNIDYWFGSLKKSKIIVKPKHLKAILANEHLKKGDLVLVGKELNIIGKVESVSDSKIHLSEWFLINCETHHLRPCHTDIREFKRYATKEEVDLFRWPFGNKEIKGCAFKLKINDQEVEKKVELLECLKINGWYEDCTLPNWLAYYDFTSNKRYGFTVNGSWFLDSNLGFFDKNNITACEKKVEEALINEAKKRGLVEGALTNNTDIVGFKVLNRQSLNIEKYVFDSENNTLVACHNNSQLLYPIFKYGKWAEVVDKFADLKEAHKNGAVIQFRNENTNYEWADCWSNIPSWGIDNEYRIKPEEPIKVGDVCKFCDDDDESVYEVGSVSRIDDFFIPYQSTSGLWYTNAKKLTKEEAIDLLFNKN